MACDVAPIGIDIGGVACAPGRRGGAGYWGAADGCAGAAAGKGSGQASGNQINYVDHHNHIISSPSNSDCSGTQWGSSSCFVHKANSGNDSSDINKVKAVQACR